MLIKLLFSCTLGLERVPGDVPGKQELQTLQSEFERLPPHPLSKAKVTLKVWLTKRNDCSLTSPPPTRWEHPRSLHDWAQWEEKRSNTDLRTV